METAVQKTTDANMIESLVLKGDLSGLSPHQKVEYYRLMCERVGLDPTTQPFKLLNLSGKQVMYCDRSGAQQLNKIHKISHEKLNEKELRDIFIVYMRAKLPDGRFTDSSGAVNIANKKGDELANAIMKAETKAKRRATLDLLGLGILDESEVEIIPNAQAYELRETALPQAESQGASFDQFDPAKEIISFGKKYNGVEWANADTSYLEWLSETSSSQEIKTKALVTLEYKKKISEQVPDPLDEAFGEKKSIIPKEPPPEQLTPIEILQTSLDAVILKGSLEGLDGWAKINKPEIDKLPETDRVGLRKAFNAAKKQLKEGVQ